jgi:Golgi nucleoside diphosphatase
MKVRINNIGAEPTYYLFDAKKDNNYELSIVKYHPNRYYEELEKYLKDGWEDRGDCIYHNNVSISKECFKNKETNYVIAFVKYDEGSQSTHLTSVADRLLYIEEDEKKDFFEVYKIADRMIIEKVEKDEKEVYKS